MILLTYSDNTWTDSFGTYLNTDCLDEATKSKLTHYQSLSESGVPVKLTRTFKRFGNQRLSRTNVGVEHINPKPIPKKCIGTYVLHADTGYTDAIFSGTDDLVEVADENVINFIHTESVGLRPRLLKMSDIKWKYLVRSIIRGKNIMMTGPAGCGKTFAAKAAREALGRPDFYFNLGATQDPRSTLVGNTHFSKEDGTFFTESLFVKAIQTENAVILLDELSRAHPDAWNILMTVLDPGQRYLRLDEHPDSPTVKVAEGVTFIGTANIGHEYTSTRTMDKALLDRFTIIEMDVLTEEQEVDLLTQMYPSLDSNLTASVAGIANLTREAVKSDSGQITNAISTRTTVEVCSLITDGFSLEEAAEVTIYPQYDNTGGVDSERTYVKQCVQKYINTDADENIFNVDSDQTTPF
jgi:hypothetical protein